MANLGVFAFLSLCGNLKRTVRTGWTRYNINNPESVSDHMYRMALMCMVIPKNIQEETRTDRVMKMAVVHDLAECIVGDITPFCGVSKEEKLNREKEAMQKLSALIPPENSAEIMELWEEYVAQTTNEAKLCKDFDRLEMLLQAFEYEQEMHSPGRLQEFYTYQNEPMKTDLGKQWLNELCSIRENGSGSKQVENQSL